MPPTVSAAACARACAVPRTTSVHRESECRAPLSGGGVPRRRVRTDQRRGWRRHIYPWEETSEEDELTCGGHQPGARRIGRWPLGVGSGTAGELLEDRVHDAGSAEDFRV